MPIYDLHGKKGENLLGVFSDGGVADNFAVKTPESFSIHIHKDNERYNYKEGLGHHSFKDRTEFVLMLDGSQRFAQKEKSDCSRWDALWRLADVASNGQANDAERAMFNFAHNVGIRAGVVSLGKGSNLPVLPTGNPLSNLTGFMSQMRTHLDAFNLQECAALAYYGYSMIDVLCKERASFFDKLVLNQKPPLEFKNILPEGFNSWNHDPNSMYKTLRSSHHRCVFFRCLSRKFGLFSLK